MRSSFSRTATALALAFSLWMSAIAIVAAPQQPTSQPQDQQQSGQTTEAQDKKQDQKPAASAPAATNRKPLSNDEDPAMIGKRKINSGLFAKMAGGTDSEIRQGRQIAAEIDKQAKFIEDPIITEYVNRVGQNIVLHSDAKIPFTIKVVDTDEVNAFALPGGFFYVNRGLILAADNEAELDVVLPFRFLAGEHFLGLFDALLHDVLGHLDDFVAGVLALFRDAFELVQKLQVLL